MEVLLLLIPENLKVDLVHVKASKCKSQQQLVLKHPQHRSLQRPSRHPNQKYFCWQTFDFFKSEPNETTSILPVFQSAICLDYGFVFLLFPIGQRTIGTKFIILRASRDRERYNQ